MIVVIEEEALDDLVEIHEWIAADDPPAADSTVERIFDAIDRLGSFPLIGHKGRHP
jgi:plasmid stabilization system protein ParE